VQALESTVVLQILDPKPENRSGLVLPPLSVPSSLSIFICSSLWFSPNGRWRRMQGTQDEGSAIQKIERASSGDKVFSSLLTRGGLGPELNGCRSRLSTLYLI
jgi:hypothetical protein